MKRNKKNTRWILSVTVCAIVLGAVSTASARPPSNWRYRGWSDGFNGSYVTKHWKKSTQQFPAVSGGSGRGVGYFTWMVDFAQISGRHCLRIKSNSYGTIDKGGALDSQDAGAGGQNLKQGWFEATTKLSSLNSYFWPTWWTMSPFHLSKQDELDIMEYAYGNFGVKHWRHDGGTTKKAGKDWYKGNSYIQSNLVNKFSMWSVKSDSSGTKFYKDNGYITGGSTKVLYGMFMRLSSSPNRRSSGTPNNTTFPNFYVDYVHIWTP